MLRVYKPIKHDIFQLQTMLEHSVCSVWCIADESSCEEKLDERFRNLYSAYKWLKIEVDFIYEIFKGLPSSDRDKIKDAFLTDNSIEDLCSGKKKPVYLDSLPEVVEKDIKPLLVDFYETLLERAKVPGTKKDYYEKLITTNDFRFCPCCGLIDIELEDSKNREAFDHYLPKAHYPFASVNFMNLVPLCHKCNSDRKGDKDPIEKGRKAFYPFSKEEPMIEIKFTLDKSKNFESLKREDLKIGIDGDKEKIETWNILFDIKERYNDITRSFTKTHLRKIKRRHTDIAAGKPDWSYTNSLDKIIEDYEFDKYEDKKFLKIALMEELKNCPELIDVYE